tara:strand:+ start:445 stop:1317 length:873 start_codon:yes stop_codon:yes gene_type:complete
MIKKELNTKQVSNLFGVDESTVRRWSLAGKIKSSSSAGGHRNFSYKNIIEFAKNKNLNTAINLEFLIGKNKRLNDAITDTNFDYLINYSYTALKEGKKNKFFLLMTSLLLKSYTFISIFDGLIIPLLHRIGEKWINNKLSISEEHIASNILINYLININFHHQSNNTKYNAFCFTLEKDEHGLPLHMGETILNQIGTIKTYNLGPNLPIRDLLKFSEKVQPHIIFISIIYYEDSAKVNSQIKELYAGISPKDTHIFLKGAGAQIIHPDNNIHLLQDFQDFYSFLMNNYSN